MKARPLVAAVLLISLASSVFLWIQAEVAVPENSVEKIEEKLEAGNFGTRSKIKVFLENGSTFEYESYDSHHPLCENDNKYCGEDSKEIGYDEAHELLNSKNFSVDKDTAYPRVYFAESTVCMKSNTSYIPC
jgi:hypothetical protein